ncbi:hypothetical protein Mapa_013987 [Marchantia paleacea]|nr:hypothetical protein Mapa_013987 [Marchantia paleacea]
MTNMASIRIIGVVGAGQMGAGIAQVVAAAKLQTVLADVDNSAVSRGMKSISSSLARFVSKGSLSQEKSDATLGRIKTTVSLSELRDADLVIEAVSESEDLKKRIFSELDRVVKPSAILASNTSSISITRIASFTQRPQQVMGMHFMNPPPLMKLVELIRGLQTDEAVFNTVCELAQRLGKTVSCSRDYPGFVVNRILMPMINEAFIALQEGVATAEDIDMGMKLGTNQAMGPLTLADFIGLDTCLAIMRVLHHGLGDSKYRPSPLLVQYVDAGWLGRKTGRGVYNYKSAL